MRAITGVIAILGLCAVATGCGQASAGTHAAPAWHAVPAPASRPVRVVGGTAAQRALLHRIVAAMTVSQITQLRIEPVDSSWKPDPGDVELMPTLVWTMRPGQENTRGEWEASIVGGAFRDRSAAAHLPTVLVVGDGNGASRVTPPNGHAPTSPPSGAEALQRRITARLLAAGFDRGYVQVGTPDGYAIAVDIRTARPGWFLQHRLKKLDKTLDPWRFRTDGLLVKVTTLSGALAYNEGSMVRIASGFGGASLRYQGCVGGGDIHPAIVTPGESAQPKAHCPSDGPDS